MKQCKDCEFWLMATDVGDCTKSRTETDEDDCCNLFQQREQKPSKAEVEELITKLAKDITRWFRNWREQFPEENKDHEELPLNNAKNIVSIMLKKYRELLRRG